MKHTAILQILTLLLGLAVEAGASSVAHGPEYSSVSNGHFFFVEVSIDDSHVHLTGEHHRPLGFDWLALLHFHDESGEIGSACHGLHHATHVQSFNYLTGDKCVDTYGWFDDNSLSGLKRNPPVPPPLA